MERPLATYFIPAYQQERFVAESIRSALAQTYSPLEVIVMDDASKDGTARAIREVTEAYAGPHQIRLFLNERNVGIQAQVNRGLREARGRYFIGSAGDDLSTPDRVEKVVERFLATGAFAVYSNSMIIDAEGTERTPLMPADYVLPGSWLEIARDLPGFPGSANCWDLRIFELFGPLPARGAEDMVTLFRAALLGRMEYLPEMLVRYRRHGNNLSRWTEDHDGSWAAYLALNNRVARDKQAVCGAFLADLERFATMRPEMDRGVIEEGREALRAQIAYFAIRERVTAGARLDAADLLRLLSLRARFPKRWIAATVGLGVSPGLMRAARRVLGR